jgi:hypothetical protein
MRRAYKTNKATCENHAILRRSDAGPVCLIESTSSRGKRRALTPLSHSQLNFDQ